VEINSRNVGRIAERIVMNELEARGFHIIDLAYTSKTSANVDFIASKNGKSYYVQVKGMTNKPNDARWSFQYGYCDEDIIKCRSPLYNGRQNAALKADVIVLLAVKSPADYRAIVMDVDTAETAAQLNISCYYRQSKTDGGIRKPGKIWVELEPPAKPRKQDAKKDRERALLRDCVNAWERTLGGGERTPIG
jgi:hypothetical protein